MQKLVTMGDTCKCTDGSVPCTLIIVDPTRKMTTDVKPVAVETDATILNLPTFGMCKNLNNPLVASATAAAQGVLTPAPCVPALVGKWSGTVSKLKVNGAKAVGEKSKTKCTYGGSISVQITGNRSTESE